MRCSKCSYISFDHFSSCSKCGTDLSGLAEQFQGTSVDVQVPFFLGSAVEHIANDDFGFSIADDGFAGHDSGQKESVDLDFAAAEPAAAEPAFELDFSVAAPAAEEKPPEIDFTVETPVAEEETSIEFNPAGAAAPEPEIEAAGPAEIAFPAEEEEKAIEFRAVSAAEETVPLADTAAAGEDDDFDFLDGLDSIDLSDLSPPSDTADLGDLFADDGDSMAQSLDDVLGDLPEESSSGSEAAQEEIKLDFDLADESPGLELSLDTEPAPERPAATKEPATEKPRESGLGEIKLSMEREDD